jgi:hypothetical protein
LVDIEIVVYLCSQAYITMITHFQDPFELQVLAEIAGLDKEKAELLGVLKKYREVKRKTPITRATDNANWVAPATPEAVVPQAAQYRAKGMPPIPETYDKYKLSWDEKCLYALSKLGKSLTNQVVGFIQNEESDTNTTTIINAVSNKLSKMAKAGWIAYERADGKKYKYSLVDHK